MVNCVKRLHKINKQYMCGKVVFSMYLQCRFERKQSIWAAFGVKTATLAFKTMISDQRVYPKSKDGRKDFVQGLVPREIVVIQ
eukprot:3751318-Ditylum_brightwellii.AAC.1